MDNYLLYFIFKLLLQSQLLLFEFASSITSLNDLFDAIEDLALVPCLKPLESLGFEFQFFDLEHIVGLESIFEVLRLLSFHLNFGLDLGCFGSSFNFFQSFVPTQPFFLL